MTTRRTFALAAAAFLLAAATPAALNAKGDEVRMRTALSGPRLNGLTPSGKAESRSATGRADLNVQVEDVKVAAGTVLDVLLDGAKVGTITVDGLTLGGELDLNTNDGDVVPSVRKGSLVVVQLNGQSILAGVF